MQESFDAGSQRILIIRATLDRMQGRVKEVFEAVRKITGKQASRVRVVKDQTGEVITDQEGVRSRCLEHFKQLYNPHRDTDDTVFSELPVVQWQTLRKTIALNC